MRTVLHARARERPGQVLTGRGAHPVPFVVPEAGAVAARTRKGEIRAISRRPAWHDRPGRRRGYRRVVIFPARATGTGPVEAPGTEPEPTTPDVGDEALATGGASGVVLVEPPSPAELVEGAVATWRAALVEAAGGSTLVDVDLLGDAALDLSAAHPSGMAQLFAGRETRLSNLVREGAALSSARRRARAVGARAQVYAQRYGIAPTSLAIGVATWTESTGPASGQDDVAALATVTRATAAARPADDEPVAPRTVRAPVLLRPVTLRARGTGESDYELALEPSLEVNPVLARALRSRGALLDPAAVARGAFTPEGFDPRAALRRLASLGEAVLDDFELTDRVIVGSFVHPGQVLVDDLDNLAGSLERHEVVAALAGVEPARERLAVPLPAPVTGDRDPDQERGVGDLSPEQQHVLDVVATGAHVFVDAPAGADVTGTLAALVADAAASGRTVLYVPGHRRAATSLSERLTALGLGDLVLDVAPEAGWRSAAARRLLGAMTLEAPGVDSDHLHGLRTELVRHRERLRGYVDVLHQVREPWGASAYDALQQLARLTSARPTPRTTVRLEADEARALDAGRRAELAHDLQRFGELGGFDLRPSDTPWYGADLRTRADADVALRRLERLEQSLPALRARMEQVVADTGLVAPVSVEAWGEQLAMLDGVRGALDVFLPIVFERTAADLVAATATAEWRSARGVEMGYWVRRRLRKQAKDMLRPGRPVADLHAALLEVQAQREVWQAHCPSGGWPRLPDGLEEIEDAYRALRVDVDALDEVLATTPGGAGLSRLPLDELAERLERLRSDTDALERLPERTGLLHRLRAAGLAPLVDDLASRRVDPALAAAELDLAWWSTVFEQILVAEPAIAAFDGETLGRMSGAYADLDRAHVASLSGPVLAAVAAHTATAVRQYREQAEELFAVLVEERVTSLRDTFGRYAEVARRLRPVVMASPMLVPQVLPATRTVDLVVLDSAAHLPLEVALAAVARGRQVVVVGDARCASGTAVGSLAQVLPSVAVPAESSRRDPWLTAFLAGHGYEGVLRPTPLPEHRPLVRLDVVDGTGMPDRTSGTVESTAAEVAHVLELVLEHVLSRPHESLAVVTVTATHADAIREAVLSEVRTNPALAAFFDVGRAEPFVVTELANASGLRREAVILSLGLGRTPHRRVLHTFGAVSAPGGDALLLDALGSTRHRLSVVSCFGADDLDPERVRGDGPRLLRDLLAFAAARGADAPEAELVRLVVPAPPEGTEGSTEDDTPEGSAPGAPDAPPADDQDDEPDRLLLDLAERLWRVGFVVEVQHGLPGGIRIPMVVGHPDAPDQTLVAVLTDDDRYVAEPSVRVRDRLVADRLERLGWSVLRVWSAAAFLDPQAEVDRIRRAVHARVPAPAAPRSGPVVLGLPAAVDDDDAEPLPAPGDTAPAAPAAPADGTAAPHQPASVAVELATDPVRLSDVAATGLIQVVEAPSGSFAPVWPARGTGTTTPGGAHVAEDHAEPATPPAQPAAQTEVQPASAAAPVEAAHDDEVPAHVEEPPAVSRPVQLALAVPSRPRPDVRRGLPIGAYSDDQLDDLAAWICSDGEERSRDDLAAELRDQLGITRRSHRVDTAIRGAVERALR